MSCSHAAETRTSLLSARDAATRSAVPAAPCTCSHLRGSTSARTLRAISRASLTMITTASLRTPQPETLSISTAERSRYLVAGPVNSLGVLGFEVGQVDGAGGVE